MNCNKKNCPLVGNNENCDIKDCKWRTKTAELKRGEVNAVKEYEDAIFQLEHNKINLGEYESLIEPLKHLYAVEPCTDSISREYALGVIYPSNTYPSRADIYKALKDAPSVTAETDIDDYMKGYDHGAADTWKIAQTVFASEVTLYEAMDVAKCMKGADDEN